MTENIGPVVHCPQCDQQINWNKSYPFRPFCSERCKMIDFGSWANEQHTIAGDPIYLDNLDDLPQQ